MKIFSGLRSTRFIDVLSIVLLALFANELCSIKDIICWSEVVRLLSFGIGGVSLSFLYSIYSNCHEITRRENSEKAYSEYYYDVVEYEKAKIFFLVIMVIVAIVLLLMFVFIKLKVFPDGELDLNQITCLDKPSLDSVCSFK